MTDDQGLPQSEANFDIIVADNVKESTKCVKNICAKDKAIEPWITTGLLQDREQDTISTQVIHQPFNAALRNRFQAYRNKLNNLFKRSKKKFLQTTIQLKY